MKDNTLTSVPADIMTDALAKQNITEKLIAEYKEKFLGLKIKDIKDTAGYNAVDEARKVCKNTRVLAGKICKAGREEAVKVQKEWIAKEKEVTGDIQEIETYLEIQLQKIDDEKAAIKLEIERKASERIANRIKSLVDNGCLFDGTYYIISDIPKYTYQQINIMDDIQWEQYIQEVKAENERLLTIQREEDARAKAEQEHQEKLRQEEEERMRIEREKLDEQKKEQEAREQKLRDAEQELENQKKLEEARRDSAAAERKRIQDENEAMEKKLLADKQARERAEALKPDKDKLLELGIAIKDFKLPVVDSEEAIDVLMNVQGLLIKVNNYIIEKTEKIS